MRDGTKFKNSLFYRAIYRYKIENYGWELLHFKLKIIMCCESTKAIKFTIIIEMKYRNKVQQEYWVEETNKQIHVLH